jgi:hypothetical protein
MHSCIWLSVDSCVPKINLSLKDDCDYSSVLSIVLKAYSKSAIALLASQ